MSDPLSVEPVQRRTLRTLVTTQALGGIGVGAAVSVNALLAKDVSGSEGLAGLAQTGQVLGTAVAAAALAGLMGRRGRRVGLSVGYLVGAGGAALCLLAGSVRSFPLLLLGAVLIGSTTAANNQSRYAAVDLSQPARRGRDLGTVVWATTVGAVLGPNLTGAGAAVAERLGVPELTGPYVFAAAGMLLATAVMLVRLRPDPLLLARRLAADSPADPAAAADPVAGEADPAPEAQARRASAWAVVRARPRLLAAASGLALAQAAMVSVMVMTPIHMDHGHATLQVIGLVISVHILGMYAFSPAVGWLVDRAGATTVLLAGGIVLLVSLSLAGTSPDGASWRLAWGLFLLGVGWSLAAVAASALIAATTPVEHRTGVQGLTDMTTGMTAALGGAVAGVIVGTAGFSWLTVLAAVMAVGVAGAALVASRRPTARPLSDVAH